MAHDGELEVWTTDLFRENKELGVTGHICFSVLLVFRASGLKREDEVHHFMKQRVSNLLVLFFSHYH